MKKSNKMYITDMLNFYLNLSLISLAVYLSRDFTIYRASVILNSVVDRTINLTVHYSGGICESSTTFSSVYFTKFWTFFLQYPFITKFILTEGTQTPCDKDVLFDFSSFKSNILQLILSYFIIRYFDRFLFYIFNNMKVKVN